MPRYAVYYRKTPTFHEDPSLTRPEVLNEKTHSRVITLAGGDRGLVYSYMQAENWSPNGEARPIIGRLGLHHASMSIGDVLHNLDTDKMWEVASCGWNEVGDTPRGECSTMLKMLQAYSGEEADTRE